MARLAVDPDFASVRGGDVLNDAQSQSAPAGFAGETLVNLKKALEYFLSVGCVNPCTVVLHFKDHLLLTGKGAQSDAFDVVRILEGIIEQI